MIHCERISDFGVLSLYIDGVKMIRIAHITDIHLNDEMSGYYKTDSVKNTNIVADDILRRNIKYAFFTGDNGDAGAFKKILQKLESNGIKVCFTLGNHDDSREALPLLSDFHLGKCFFYSFDIGDMQILFLDSGNEKIDRKQLSWLRDTVRTVKKKLIFVHHPLLNCEETILDEKYPLRNRAEVVELLEETDEEFIVFAGHYHNEYSKKRGKIRQFVTPSCQLQYAKSRDAISVETFNFGYRIISADPDSVKTEVVMFDK